MAGRSTKRQLGAHAPGMPTGMNPVLGRATGLFQLVGLSPLALARQLWPLALGGGAALVLPYVSLVAIDEGILAKRLDVLAIVVVIGLLAHGAQAWLTQRGRIRLASLGGALWRRLRERVFDRLQSASLAYHARTAPGDSLSLAQHDTWMLRNFVENGLAASVLLVVEVGGSLLVMAWLAPRLVVVALLPIPIVFVLLFVFRRIRRASARTLQLHAALDNALLEALEGNESVRQLNREALMQERVADRGRALEAHELAVLRESIKLQPWFDFAIALMVLGSLGLGGYWVIEGALSLGTMVAFSFYVSRSLAPVRGVAELVVSYQQAQASAERLGELLTEAEPSAPDGVLDCPSDAAWELDEVHYTYRNAEGGGVAALQGLSLRLEPGSRTAVLGPSGAGKSTLLRLIVGALQADAGCLRVGGQRQAELSRASLRRQVAVLPQHVFVLQGTLRDNLLFANPEATPGAIDEALSDAALDDVVARHPGGLDFELGLRGAHLSGGERKRLGLARALLRKPSLLVIDQLASDLQEPLCRRIFEALSRRPGLGVLYLGHRMPAGFRPEASFWMEDGRLRPYQGEGADGDSGDEPEARA